MERHGNPIQNYPLRDKVHHGITFSLAFEEYEACVAAGLDLGKWESGEYEQPFKAKVVAWYRLHHLVRSHTSEATDRHLARKAKRK